MPFERPTLSALVARVRADIRGRLSIAGPLVRRAMADVFGAVWGGAVHMLHGHVSWAAEQLFADKAERPYLLRRAAMWGVLPTAATYATGSVTATGTNGSIIAADSIIQLDAETKYRTVGGATIVGGTVAIPVVALTAGSSSNVAEGATLTFESPIAGVDSSVTVGPGDIDGGFNEESTEEVRARFKLRLQEPPAGGADQDYEAWALAVAGVTRAWVYPTENGLGTVVVRFVMDGTPEVPRVDIFPTPSEVAAVQTALATQRPVTAEVTAVAPTPLPINFTLSVTPDTTAVRTAITAELADLLKREAEPGDGVARGTIRVSKLRTAIDLAEGVEDYTLASPAANVVPGLGQLAVMGTVTFT